MSLPLTIEQAAELLVHSKIAWTGPRSDLVIEPGGGGRCLVLPGTGDAGQAFQRAQELRKRLRDAFFNTVCNFVQQERQKVEAA